MASSNLNWRNHAVCWRFGSCRICGKPALMRDENGQCCHKVCAEAALDRLNHTGRNRSNV